MMIRKIISGNKFSSNFHTNSQNFRSVRLLNVRSGFTLVELIVVSAILGVLVAMAIPAFNEYVIKAKVAKSLGDLTAFDKDIQAYYIDKNVYPDALSDIGRGGLKDPWGTVYQYHKITALGDALKGSLLVLPLNSDLDYDLYSMGPDTASAVGYNAATCADDIVRANGGFGLRKLY